MIPGTKPDAIPAGFPPPNHFFVALKIERWRPLRETIWSDETKSLNYKKIPREILFPWK